MTVVNMTSQTHNMQSRFTCRFCHKVMVKEDAYLKHRCKQMERDEEFKSPIGQAAWHYYQFWMRQQKRMPPTAGSFLTSKYFRTFVNFVNFIRRVDLPRPEKFVRYMVSKNYPPTMWQNDDVYVQYIEFIDVSVEPLEQFTMSVSTLLKIAERHDQDISSVFTLLTPADLIHLVRVRKVSPWLLLLSKRFKVMFKEQCTPEQRIMLEALIRPPYWMEQMKQRPDDVNAIKEYIVELDL